MSAAIEGIPPTSWDNMIKGAADAVKRALDDGTFWEIIGEAPKKEVKNIENRKHPY